MSAPSPWFRFWSSDWRTSQRVRRMSMARRGVYLELVLESWDGDGLPAALEDVLELMPRQAARSDVAAVLESHFPVAADGRRRNEKVEAERKRAIESRDRNRANGMSGGRPAGSRNATQQKPSGFPVGSPAETQPKPSGVPTDNPVAKHSRARSGSGSGSVNSLPTLSRDAEQVSPTSASPAAGAPEGEREREHEHAPEVGPAISSQAEAVWRAIRVPEAPEHPLEAELQLIVQRLADGLQQETLEQAMRGFRSDEWHVERGLTTVAYCLRDTATVARGVELARAAGARRPASAGPNARSASGLAWQRLRMWLVQFSADSARRPTDARTWAVVDQLGGVENLRALAAQSSAAIDDQRQEFERRYGGA